MKNKKIFLMISISVFLTLISTVQATDEWWNTSWNYRVRLDINTTDYSRTNWPIEYEINFTNILSQMGESGIFDFNSTRVFEYNSSGQIMYEVTSQFDKVPNYDASTNAVGTLVFLMNGTTNPNVERYYQVYFDTIENGAKNPPDYTTDLVYNWDGEEFNVNNTILQWYVDTMRGENTSGLYKVRGELMTLLNANQNERTAEYMEYRNDTHNLTFDLGNNASFTVGPVRITVRQVGDEILWNKPENKTGQGNIIKEYVFYSNNPWIRIKQNFTNIGTSSIKRRSTEVGALAFDIFRANTSTVVIDELNLTEPASWVWARQVLGDWHIGVINLNESGTTNFTAMNSTSLGRIGIHLNETTIPPGSSIDEEAIVHFNDSSADPTQFKDFRKRLVSPASIYAQSPEIREVAVRVQTDYPTYNRNESILVMGNITSDPYNLTVFMNATLDMGTASGGDDQTIVLYDDGTNGDEIPGDKVFSNFFKLSTTDNIGTWNITVKTYDSTGYYLNQSFGSFEVTDIYNVSVSISNSHGFANRTILAEMLVQNFMRYSNISNAIVNCSFDGVTVYNITDNKNGTYSINFTAPADLGTYVLSCNATRDGNKGNGTDTFWVEPKKTYMSSEIIPIQYTAKNITWNVSESFYITVNITNIGQGWAFGANITLQLPKNTPLNWTANYTLYECGDLYINDSCWSGFNITVLEKTLSGIYLVNASAIWRNPDGTTNITNASITVNVTSNPLMEIPEDLIEGIVGGGMEKTVGNFTIRSIGNDPLFNVTFNVTGLPDFNVTFIPVNFTSIDGSVNETVLVNVSVPKGYLPGLYNATINVSTTNDGSKNITLSITVSGTNMTVETQPSDYTVTTIKWNVSESFEVFVNITNIGNGTAYSANITLQLPKNTPLNWTANNTINPLYECGDVDSLGDYCTTGFNITVTEKTPSGNYLINVSAVWLDPETGQQNTTIIFNVTVTSNPLLYIIEDAVSGEAIHGKESYLSNFTIQSIGNDPLLSIEYNISGLPSSFNFELINNVTSLNAGNNATILVNVTIPLGYDPGIYLGSLNVTTDNDGYKNLTLNVSVPINRTWETDRDYCEHPMTPKVGVVCEVIVNNTGNVEVNITISPKEGNYTWVNETNFTVPKQSWHTFSVQYNVTGVTLHFNYSYYLIDANQTDAIPDNITLTVVLTPYVGPDIDIILVPDEIEQTGSLEIYANVTDRSGEGLKWVKVNVTTPDNITNGINMTYVGVTGPNVTMWNATYPKNWGNTTLRGIYEVVAHARDNMTAYGNATATFFVYTRLFITLNTMSDTYYRGETGTINYRARDASGLGLNKVNASLTIKDPNKILLFNSSYETDPGGYIQPLPQFTLTSDAPIGDYNLSSVSFYYDEEGSKLVNDTSNYTFSVYGKEGMLTLDLQAPFEVATGEDLQVSATVTDGMKNVDVDSAVASLFDPLGNQILYDIPMTTIGVGKYVSNYTTSSSSNQGNWKWVVTVTKDANTISKDIFERLIGGPLDVRNITIVDNTISDLEVSVVVENTGEATFDVFVEWNLTRTDTGERLDGGLDTVRIDGNSEKTHTVYPSTDYVGEVKITFIAYYSGTEKAGAYDIFNTQVGVTTTTVPAAPPEGPPTEEAPPPAPAPPPVEGVGKIEIVKYPQEIAVERGWVKYPSVVVNNTGEVALRNVILSISGIPTSWYSIEPSKLDLLPVGDSVVFNIKLEVPITAEAEEYYGQFKVDSSQASDEKMFVLLVFESREELLNYEIKKLKKDIQDFEEEVEKAKEDGKDVSEVERLLEEAKNQVGFAEDYLLRKMFDDALASVFAARSLLDRAKYALSVAPYMKRVLIPFIPTWLMIVLVILAVVIVVLLIWLKKLRFDLKKIFRPGEAEVKAAEEVKATPEKEALEAERDKVKRMLKLLETERKEGIITKKAYEELKFRNETKLKEIEEKLKEVK